MYQTTFSDLLTPVAVADMSTRSIRRSLGASSNGMQPLSPTNRWAAIRRPRVLCTSGLYL